MHSRLVLTYITVLATKIGNKTHFNTIWQIFLIDKILSRTFTHDCKNNSL